MTRLRLSLLAITCCLLSGALGYWFGFREGLYFGVAADFMPRGVIATSELNALRAGNQTPVVIMLESEVDNGLIFGHDLFQHPLREAVSPVWGFSFYPEYENYAVRLANYRKEHPSQLSADMFDTVPQGQMEYREQYKELSVGVRESLTKINSMVARYATKQ
jgi:hypothetical protein